MASSSGSSYLSCQETINFARLCWIVVDVLRDILWQVLIHEIPAADLPNRVQTDQNKLGKLDKKIKKWLCGISPSSLEIPTAEKFDSSSLYTLIRNLCSQVPTPSTQWGKTPPPGGTTLGDDIERVREFRNTLYGHATQAKIDTTDFKKLCNDIKNVVSRFDVYFNCKAMKCDFKSEIDTILTCSMDKSLQDAYVDKMKEIAILSDEVEDVKQQVGNVEQKIGGLEQQVGNVEQQVGSLEQKSGGLEHQVGSLEHQVGNVEQQVGGLEHQVGNVEQQVGNAEQKIGGLEQQVGNVEQQVGGLEQQVGNVEQRVGNVEQQVGNVEQQVGGLKQHVKQHDGDVKHLKKEIKEIKEILKKPDVMEKGNIFRPEDLQTKEFGLDGSNQPISRNEVPSQSFQVGEQTSTIRTEVSPVLEGNNDPEAEKQGNEQSQVQPSDEGKSSEWNFSCDDINVAWQSIEEYLLEELTPKNILPYLEKCNIFSAEECKTICLLRNRRQIAEKILNRIKETLPEAFNSLLRALKESKEEGIVDELINIITRKQNPEINAPVSGMHYYTVKLDVLEDGKPVPGAHVEIGKYLRDTPKQFKFNLSSEMFRIEISSVTIYLRPLSQHAQDTLGYFCMHGGMKNFVLDLLKKNDIFSSLPEGKICIQVQVRCYNRDSTSQDGNDKDFTQMTEEILLNSLETFEVLNEPQVIKQNLLFQFGYIVEEIEPLQFQDTFVGKGIWEKQFFNQLKTIKGRRARAVHFLNEVLSKDNSILSALVDALKNNGNEDLASRLCFVEKQSQENKDRVDDSLLKVVSYVPETHAEGDLWSCHLEVSIVKNVDEPVLPEEILRMDEQSIQMFKDALRDRKENVYNIRVMVVGQFGVGKTTLSKRLLGDDVNISKRESTEEIDVHIHRCRVSRATGEWSKQDKDAEQFDKLQRYCNVLSDQSQLPDVGDEQVGKSKVMPQMKTALDVKEKSTSLGTDQMGVRSSSSKSSDLSSEHQSSAEDNEGSRASSKVKPGDKKNSFGNILKEDLHKMLEQSLRNADKNDSKDTVKNMLQFLNENAPKLVRSRKESSPLAMWDFAGQYVYYTTHQTFLTQRAIYLLVIDLTQEAEDYVKDDECFVDIEGKKQCQVHDLVELWLNSIHSCAPSLESDSPPVILVGTHMDKIPQDVQHVRCERVFRHIRSYYLKERPARLHLADADFAIDNTFVDPKLKDLQKKIMELASKQPHWGESIPTRWLLLEEGLMSLKAKGVKVIPYHFLEKMNQEGDVKIELNKELELFLKFQHDIGNILYFSTNELREWIVLEPQWLIKAMKSLITADMFILRKHPRAEKNWIQFKEEGKLTPELLDIIWNKEHEPDLYDYKALILLLMEQLNIIARPRLFIEDEDQAEDFFLAPCMLRTTAPKEVISPKVKPEMESSSVLCFVFREKFFPSPIFHRLLAVCIAKWPIQQKMGTNQIFCGCGVFQIHTFYRLTLYFKSYVIYARVSGAAAKHQTLDAKVCIPVRKFISDSLSKILGNLSQNLTFELFMQCQCPKSVRDCLGNMTSVKHLRSVTELPCPYHDLRVESNSLLKYWFQNEVGEQTSPVKMGVSPVLEDYNDPKADKPEDLQAKEFLLVSDGSNEPISGNEIPSQSLQEHSDDSPFHVHTSYTSFHTSFDNDEFDNDEYEFLRNVTLMMSLRIYDSILRKLSEDLVSHDWKFFFRALSVPENELDQVQIDYHGNIQEQIYQLLCRLNQRGSLNKTSIIEALKSTGRKDLVDTYSRMEFSKH